MASSKRLSGVHNVHILANAFRQVEPVISVWYVESGWRYRFGPPPSLELCATVGEIPCAVIALIAPNRSWVGGIRKGIA